MNLQRLLMMIVNPILRRLVSKAVDAGFNRFSGPAEKAPHGSKQGKDTAKRLRQSMRIGRKLW